ncbi:hypothetical protein [Micromonospora sp. NBC_01813]|uniref:hypothetical protein n=1 Tax=Micromonospora sp. NBC_01813 TaxID=2975988 RepID=UPI002DD97B78|nr:hypothetical protein [Micromonospora sp. NBC_01813]WSA09231.1 hypothetical protein OG958_34675 [Micromonospora sp. NBC_01813]
MLQETDIPYLGTSWPWLDDPDELEEDELIDPFDGAIYQVAPPENPGVGPTYSRTDGLYEPRDEDEASFQRIHRRVLGQAIAGLAHNARIVEGKTTKLVPDAEAEMAEDGESAVAVAAIGVNALAGTGGVSPCVAVLARAPAGNRWRVGCIHLSADDMKTLELVIAALDRLLTKLSQTGPDASTGPVELYVVGGCEDENVAYEEFGRVIAAAQLRAAGQSVVQVQLAGALVPACADEQYVDVYIGSGGVTYSVEQG